MSCLIHSFFILDCLKKGVPIDEVVEAGPALVFIAFPDALRLLPAPQLFSIMFFGMVLFYITFLFLFFSLSYA